MEKNPPPYSDEDLANYPIKDLVDGWFFRIQQVSNGVYEDEALKACAEDARQIRASSNKE